MNFWLLIIGMGIITYAIRLSLIITSGRVTVPPTVQRALRYVPAAVLTGIIFPDMLVVDGAISPLNPRFFAGIIAMIVAFYTKNVVWTVAAGMGALWLIQASIG